MKPIYECIKCNSREICKPANPSKVELLCIRCGHMVFWTNDVERPIIRKGEQEVVKV